MPWSPRDGSGGTRPATGAARFLIGASTSGPGRVADGVRRLDVLPDGSLHLGPATQVGPAPMFLCRVGPDRIAVAHEVADGLVSLWREEDGALDRLGPSAQTGGADPCHLAASTDDGLLLAANFSGGFLSVHPLTATSVAPPALTVRYAGSGPNADRQASSHPHQVVVDAARRRVLVTDLGADRVHVHPLDALAAGSADHEDLLLPPGCGPRHLDVRGDVIALAGELAGAVSLLDAAGLLLATSHLAAAPPAPDDPGPSTVRWLGDRHLLVADRTTDTVRVLRWDGAAKTLDPGDEHPCGGVFPRDMELSADSRWLVVANQWSDDLALFEVDPLLGTLAHRGGASTPSPTCILRTA